MKTSQLLTVISVLFFGLKTSSQTCTASFVYTLNPNGTVTFSNTSVNTTTTSPTYSWNTGNGMTYTTNSLSQTVSTTYTSSGTYFVQLTTQSCGVDFQLLNYSIPGCPLSASMTAANVVSNTAFYTPTVNFVSLSTGTTIGTTYIWNFGDGTSGTGANPTHVYNWNGPFCYTLTVINSPTCSSFIEALPGSGPGMINVCGYTPSLTYTAGLAGSTIFSVTATSEISWYLNWDLWNSPYGPIPTRTSSINHTYFNGTYTPTVFVFSTFQQFCGPFTPSASITITNNPCNANAAFTYTNGSSGTVQFSKTTPSTNTNIAYSWYFGDGVSSSQLNPTHIYSSAGNYKAILISYDLAYPITDPLDTFVTPCKVVNMVNLNITGIPCLANSNFSVSPAGPPQTYWIIPDYPYNVTSATWSWGDGSTSNTILNAFHTYSAAGNYNICLTVTTSCGATSNNCVSQYLSKGQSGDMLYVNVVAPQLTNSIREDEYENFEVKLFPNPTIDGILNLTADREFEAQEIIVYDLLGKEVYVTIPPQNEKSIKVDVRGLNNGIYILKLKSSQATTASKFIISR